MKENEAEIKKLIGELQRIEMCKDYILEVSTNIRAQNVAQRDLSRQMDRLEKEIKKIESQNGGNIFDLGNDKKREGKWADLQKDYAACIFEIKEAERMKSLLEYELNVLQEKITKEKELRPIFNALILKRKREIKSKGSRNLRQILIIVQELDENYRGQKEIEEILAEGDIVIGLIDSIMFNLKNKKLPYDFVPDESFRHPTLSKQIVEQIQLLAVKLQRSLKEFRKELSDLYDNRNTKFTYTHEKRDYYKSLQSGALIARHLIKQQIGANQLRDLEIVIVNIKEINQLFVEELKVVEMSIVALKQDKNKLLLKE